MKRQTAKLNDKLLLRVAIYIRVSTDQQAQMVTPCVISWPPGRNI